MRKLVSSLEEFLQLPWMCFKNHHVYGKKKNLCILVHIVIIFGASLYMTITSV
jgi:hypothetical protein